MDRIKIISNATVSNLGCGFDILGFATDIVSDEIILSKNNISKIRITKVDGFDPIPTDQKKNAVGAGSISCNISGS
jgi:homoserine kinase